MTTWLSILHAFELPLMFDVLIGGDVEYRDKDGFYEFEPGEEDKTTVYGASDYYVSAAVASGYVMRSGSHFTEFVVHGNGMPTIGIVRPMASLDAGTGTDYFFINDSEERYIVRSRLEELYTDFLAQRTDDWGDGNVHACEYRPSTGRMCWTNWNDEEEEGSSNTERFSNRNRATTFGMLLNSTTFGMLLNFDKGTLAVYENNRKLDVMKDGLSGPYCWYTTVSHEASVAIKKARLATTAS